MNRKEILHAAEGCVCGQREQDYGKPENNFKRIADLWEAYTGHKYTPVDVAIMLALLKVARIGSGRHHEDNFVDGCGYFALAGELAAEAEKQLARDQRLGAMMEDALRMSLEADVARVPVTVCEVGADGVLHPVAPADFDAVLEKLAGVNCRHAVQPVPEGVEAAEPVCAGWVDEEPAPGDFKPCKPLEAVEVHVPKSAVVIRDLEEALEDEANKPRPAAGAAVAVPDDADHNAEVRNMAETYGEVAEKAMEAVHEALEASESTELPGWMTEPRVPGAPCLDELAACGAVETVQNLMGEEHTIPVAVDPGAAVAEAVSNAARTINAGGACIRETVEQLGRNLQRTARR